VIAKPQKEGAKPMGQDVHVGRKTSNTAAQAASAIVNFLGFATGSSGFATDSNYTDLHSSPPRQTSSTSAKLFRNPLLLSFSNACLIRKIMSQEVFLLTPNFFDSRDDELPFLAVST
jgi:hypothetical protein